MSRSIQCLDLPVLPLFHRIADLNAAFGNRVVTSRAVRELHANTLTWIAAQPPMRSSFHNRLTTCRWLCAHLRATRLPIIPLFGPELRWRGASTRRSWAFLDPLLRT